MTTRYISRCSTMHVRRGAEVYLNCRRPGTPVSLHYYYFYYYLCFSSIHTYHAADLTIDALDVCTYVWTCSEHLVAGFLSRVFFIFYDAYLLSQSISIDCCVVCGGGGGAGAVVLLRAGSYILETISAPKLFLHQNSCLLPRTRRGWCCAWSPSPPAWRLEIG